MAATTHSTTKTAPRDIPSQGKHTRYNRETMDFDAFFDGQYLGSRDSMEAARDLVNEYVYDLEVSGALYTATALDHGSDVEDTDTIARILENVQEAVERSVQLTVKDPTWYEFAVDTVSLSIEDERPACLCVFGRILNLKAKHRADLRRLYTLLSDARVQRYLGNIQALDMAA